MKNMFRKALKRAKNHDAYPCVKKRLRTYASFKDAWDQCKSPDLIWLATRPGVLTLQELRRFADFCANSAQHLTTGDHGMCPKAKADAAVKYAEAVQHAVDAASAGDDAAFAADYAKSAIASAADPGDLHEDEAAGLIIEATRDASYDSQATWLRTHTAPRFLSQ